MCRLYVFGSTVSISSGCSMLFIRTLHRLFDLNLSQRTLVLIFTGWNWKWNPFKIYERITLFSVDGFFVSVFLHLFVWCLFSFICFFFFFSSFFFGFIWTCDTVIVTHNYIPCSHADKRCAAQSDTYLSIGLMLFPICFELNVLIYQLPFQFIM